MNSLLNLQKIFHLRCYAPSLVHVYITVLEYKVFHTPHLFPVQRSLLNCSDLPSVPVTNQEVHDNGSPLHTSFLFHYRLSRKRHSDTYYSWDYTTVAKPQNVVRIICADKRRYRSLEYYCLPAATEPPTE